MKNQTINFNLMVRAVRRASLPWQVKRIRDELLKYQVKTGVKMTGHLAQCALRLRQLEEAANK